jgi:lipopolysaccharide export system permease protein
VEESQNQGANLSGLFVRAENENGQSVAVTASTGTFLATDDPDVILLRLHNGTLVHAPKAGAVPRVLSFDQHDLPVKLPAMTNFRKRGEGNLEQTLPELWDRMWNDKTPEGRRDASATFNRRMVQCLIMFMLPFLAVALAVPPKRSTSALGVFLSLIMLVTFHKVTEYFERMASLGRADPFLSQWLPYAVFFALTLYLYRILAYVPGGQPIGGLERLVARIVSLVQGIAARFVKPETWRDDALSAG